MLFVRYQEHLNYHACEQKDDYCGPHSIDSLIPMREFEEMKDAALMLQNHGRWFDVPNSPDGHTFRVAQVVGENEYEKVKNNIELAKLQNI